MATNERNNLVKWLSDRGISCSGTVGELQARTNRTKLYPSLAEKLRKRQQKTYVFATSLPPINIPPPSAPWCPDETLYPAVTPGMFLKYASQKIEGSIGQQQKAYMMLTSRKIKSVKSLQECNSQFFLRVQIKRSFGEISRQAAWGRIKG